MSIVFKFFRTNCWPKRAQTRAQLPHREDPARQCPAWLVGPQLLMGEAGAAGVTSGRVWWPTGDSSQKPHSGSMPGPCGERDTQGEGPQFLEEVEAQSSSQTGSWAHARHAGGSISAWISFDINLRRSGYSLDKSSRLQSSGFWTCAIWAEKPSVQ